ncbi:MAG: hypothetical protein U0984_14380, partial [Prosthecobacter sp.]|nr:hypothetical protein [Prosthecobacter sp.]
LYDFALRHFLFVGEQRLKVFNFYIIILAASVAAGITAFNSEKTSTLASLAIGVFYMLTAVVFAIIEHRNISFLDIGSSTLRRLEAMPNFPKEGRIFSRSAHGRSQSWRRFFTFRWAFKMTYTAHFLVGVLIVYFSPLNFSQSGSADRSIRSNRAATTKTTTKKRTAPPSTTQGEAPSNAAPTSVKDASREGEVIK